ncbi:hypothetical protein HanIR_Chr05g0227671 [Helianthus annuus]|nr:hypothetical protein HanIR_Chr05g0227671 [Helianthus annuus]
MVGPLLLYFHYCILFLKIHVNSKPIDKQNHSSNSLFRQMQASNIHILWKFKFRILVVLYPDLTSVFRKRTYSCCIISPPFTGSNAHL